MKKKILIIVPIVYFVIMILLCLYLFANNKKNTSIAKQEQQGITQTENGNTSNNKNAEEPIIEELEENTENEDGTESSNKTEQSTENDSTESANSSNSTNETQESDKKTEMVIENPATISSSSCSILSEEYQKVDNIDIAVGIFEIKIDQPVTDLELKDGDVVEINKVLEPKLKALYPNQNDATITCEYTGTEEYASLNGHHTIILSGRLKSGEDEYDFRVWYKVTVEETDGVNSVSCLGLVDRAGHEEYLDFITALVLNKVQ